MTLVWSQVILFCLGLCTGLCTGLGGGWLWGQQRDRQRQEPSLPGEASIDRPTPALVVPSAPVPAPPGAAPQPTETPAIASAIATLQDSHLANYYAGFLARTSHELRSPLSSLMSLHQIILNDLCDDPAEERQCVQQAYNSAQRLLDMLELMTQLSKLKVGSHPRHIQPVSLLQVLQDVQMLTRLQVANRNFHLTLDLPEPTLMIQAAPGCLRQALLCLITSTVEDSQSHQAHLKHYCDREQGRLYLALDDDRPPEDWQKARSILQETPAPSPEDLLAQIRQSQDLPLPHLSPEMSLFLAREFLNLSEAELKIAPSQAEATALSGAVQCSFALVESLKD